MMTTPIDLLTDGKITVNLYGCDSDFVRRQFGYEQVVSPMDEDHVAEKLLLTWHQRDNGGRADTLARLMALRATARRYTNGDRLAGIVWREVRTASETASRYAVVSDIQLDPLDGRIAVAPRHGVPCVITITREGLWRAIPPSVVPSTLQPPTMVHNRQSGSDRPWVVLPPIDGDAPALLELTLEKDPTQRYLTGEFIQDTATTIAVWHNRGNPSTSPQFMLRPVDVLVPTYNMTNASVPGGQMLDIPPANLAATPAVFSWQLPPATTMSGEYAVYVIGRLNGATLNGRTIDIWCDATGTGRALAKHQLFDALVGTTSYACRWYAGRITLPYRTPMLPHHTYDTTPSGLAIYAQHNTPSSTGFQVYKIELVPLENSFTITDATLFSQYHQTDLVISSVWPAVLEMTSSGMVSTNAGTAPIGFGTWPRYTPQNQTSSLLIYRWFTQAIDNGVRQFQHFPFSESRVTIRNVPRFRGLRGGY